MQRLAATISPCRNCKDQASMKVLYSFGRMPVAGYLEPSRELALVRAEV